MPKAFPVRLRGLSCLPSHCWEAVAVDSLQTPFPTFLLYLLALYCHGALDAFLLRDPGPELKRHSISTMWLFFPNGDLGHSTKVLSAVSGLYGGIHFSLWSFTGQQSTTQAFIAALDDFIHISCAAYSTDQINRLYYNYHFCHPTL